MYILTELLDSTDQRRPHLPVYGSDFSVNVVSQGYGDLET